MGATPPPTTWLTSKAFTPMYIRVRWREHIPYCNKWIGPLIVKKMIWTENKLARNPSDSVGNEKKRFDQILIIL